MTAAGTSIDKDLPGAGQALVDVPARSASGEHPWRATGLEAPVFADPSGRRARGMGGIGLAILATTLAAVVIVVTAAVGFSSIPLRLSPTLLTASASVRSPGRRFTAFGHARDGRRVHVVAARVVDPQYRFSSERRD